MAQQQHQVVGIIEFDADPEWDATADEDLGRTLRRLRSSAPEVLQDAGAEFLAPAHDSAEEATNGAFSDSVVVVRADLLNLRRELEVELASLLSRLLRTGQHSTMDRRLRVRFRAP